MIKRLFSKIGIGAARYGLHLKPKILTMGETASGQLEIHGGIVPQTIDKITGQLKIRYCYSTIRDRYRQDFWKTDTLYQFPILDQPLKIEPKQNRKLSFSFTCPEQLAISSKMTHYYIGAKIELAGLNPYVREEVRLRPSGYLQTFLQGCKRLKMNHVHEGYTGSKVAEPKQFLYCQPPRIFRDHLQEVLWIFDPHHTEQGIYGTFRLFGHDETSHSSFFAKIEAHEPFHLTPEQLTTPDIAAERIKQLIARHVHLYPRRQ